MTPRLRDRLLRRYISAPDHPAKYRFVRWLGRHAMPGDGIMAGVHPGVMLWMNPLDWVEYLMLRDGSYEPMTLDFIQRNLGPSESAILAGVNNGLHAIVAARAVGATGKVVGCEPQPGALLRARLNMELNGMSDGPLHLMACALGSGRGLTSMAWSAADNPGSASLLTQGAGFTVPMLSVAELTASLGLAPIRLMLLDVQGYEIQVLDGLGDLRPAIMVVEDDPTYSAGFGRSRAVLHRRLRDLGYSLRDLHGVPVETADVMLPERNLVGVHAGCAVR